jgi:hypothetical protein
MLAHYKNKLCLFSIFSIIHDHKLYLHLCLVSFNKKDLTFGLLNLSFLWKNILSFYFSYTFFLFIAKPSRISFEILICCQNNNNIQLVLWDYSFSLYIFLSKYNEVFKQFLINSKLILDEIHLLLKNYKKF